MNAVLVCLIVENILLFALLIGFWRGFKQPTKILAILLILQALNGFIGNETVQMTMNEPATLPNVHWWQWMGVGITIAISVLLTYRAWLEHPSETKALDTPPKESGPS